jgi:hypothetical protein
MDRRAFTILTLGKLACGTVPATAAAPPSVREEEITLAGLPGTGFDGPYRVDPYLRVAAQLQSLGPERGSRRLLQLAHDTGNAQKDRFNREDSIYVLCRMLFTAKLGKVFRHPWIGRPGFVGKDSGISTRIEDWPLQPIELVDGIPFLIVMGYVFGGVPEWPWEYVTDCIRHCRWRSVRFGPRSVAEKQRALRRFLADRRWKGGLNESERRFLADQLR